MRPALHHQLEGDVLRRGDGVLVVHALAQPVAAQARLDPVRQQPVRLADELPAPLLVGLEPEAVGLQPLPDPGQLLVIQAGALPDRLDANCGLEVKDQAGPDRFEPPGKPDCKPFWNKGLDVIARSGTGPGNPGAPYAGAP